MRTKIYDKSHSNICYVFFISLFLIFGSQTTFAASLNLAWNANTESDLAGYRIYYGTSSRNYTASAEPGKVTRYTLPNLNEGTTYYIVMTAFDTSLNESQKSNEIEADVPQYIPSGSCNDGNACTTADTYVGGICVGTAINCDDGNVCTTDSCNPASGCVRVNNTASCNDGNACTTSDTCSGGICVGGSALSCDDGNVCTTDSCNPASGCVRVNNSASCNDGNACTTSDTCSGGICVGGSALTCDDGNLCTDDSCNPASGCVRVNNTASCNDGNACTAASYCMNGTCQGADPLNCDDGDGCTGDSCNPQTGCVHTATPGCWCDGDDDCSDSNLCTGIERCIDGACVSGTPPGCDDGNSCTDDSCDPQTGCVYTVNAAPCDDGLFCNGDDTCGDGNCSVHSGDPCQQLTCNEETGICEEVGIVCDNPDACSSYSGAWSTTTREDAFEGTARVSSRMVTHSWAPELPQKGFYDVSMWWSALPTGCKKCPVEILCNGEPVASFSVNQQAQGGQWNALGTYNLEAGSTCSVTLKSEGYNIKTCADAVKLVYRGESLPEARISSIAPNPAAVNEEVYLEGDGSSPSGNSIIGYRWVSDRDGEIGIADVLYLSGLSEGKHQISFSVQDEEGAWSLPVSETLYIGGVEIVCDNGETCTSSTGTWKTWKSSTAFNQTSLVSSKSGSHSWSPYLPVAGNYEVYVWWSSLRSSCSSCPVTVSCGGEVLDTVSVNQKTGGGQWNLLGSYELETGTACAVTLKSPGSYSTIADAVKFVLTDNQPNAHILFAQ